MGWPCSSTNWSICTRSSRSGRSGCKKNRLGLRHGRIRKKDAGSSQGRQRKDSQALTPRSSKGERGVLLRNNCQQRRRQMRLTTEVTESTDKVTEKNARRE